MIARYENDSVFFKLNGEKEDLRLDLHPRKAALDLDLVITAVVISNLEDETSDIQHGHFRANLLQDDGTWKEMHGNDFTYEFQRKLQPLLEQAGRETSGDMPCMMHSEFKYAHIPLHHSRMLHADLFKD
jgi:hypothetical protein